MSPPETSDSAFETLERAVGAALRVYSNVHRGTGHFSLASTALFEHAREVILDALGLEGARYQVIFCTPSRLDALMAHLRPGVAHILSSDALGLPLGLRALVVEAAALPGGVPFQTGGGAVKLVSPQWVVWADPPDRFEAGTPPIVNVIAFARALDLSWLWGEDIFQKKRTEGKLVTYDLHTDDLIAYTGRELLRALRERLLGRDVLVPVVDGQRPYINLDNGASTPTFGPIWEVVRRTWQQPRAVQEALVHQVRGMCADFLGAPLKQYEIFFVSNTTEALNLAANLLFGADAADEAPVVLNTMLEHHSNELPWRYLPGASLLRMPVDREGFVDLEALESHLRAHNREHAHGKQRIRLVAVCGASNVLGAFNDLPAIGQLAREYGAWLLVDAAQLVAHRTVDMEALGIDALAFSGHKMYAPFGSGALVIRRALLHTAPSGLDDIVASGEENVVGIAALGKAILLLQRIGLDIVEAEERALTRRLLEGLAQIPEVEVFGVQDASSARFQDRGGVVAFRFKRVPHNLGAKLLAEHGGIGVRDGCFCAHLLTKWLMDIHPLRSLAADVGTFILPRFTAAVVPGLVRISLGLENDEQDVDTLLAVVAKIARMPQPPLNRFLASTYNGTPFLPTTEVDRRTSDFVEAKIREVFG